MGRIFRLTNQIDLAMQYYQNSLSLLIEVGDRTNEAAILSNIAMLHIEAANWEEAQAHLSKAVGIDQTLGLPALEEDLQALEWVKRRGQGG
jgi:tetratricopeptide (TPR) repeat protein